MKINKNYFNYLLKEKNIRKKDLCQILKLSLQGFDAKLRNKVRFSLQEIITISILLNMPVEKIFFKEFEYIRNELKEKSHAS